MDKFETIALIIYSVLAFLVGKEFFLPQLNKLYKWLKNEKNEIEDRTLDVGQEISKLKLTEVERYEKTFETLLNQVEDLEQQLKDYSKELQELRNTILKLNAKLYQKSLVISDLQKMCCARENCQERISCRNYLCDVIDNEEEENTN